MLVYVLLCMPFVLYLRAVLCVYWCACYHACVLVRVLWIILSCVLLSMHVYMLRVACWRAWVSCVHAVVCVRLWLACVCVLSRAMRIACCCPCILLGAACLERSFLDDRCAANRGHNYIGHD